MSLPPTSEPSPSNTITGRATGLIRKLVKRVKPADPSPATEPESISDTSATDTAPTAILLQNLLSSTPVSDTPIYSTDHTVWTSRPLGFIESGDEITPADFQALPEDIRTKLLTVAHGMNVDPTQLVRDIVGWMTDDYYFEIEDETLLDVVTQYTKSYII